MAFKAVLRLIKHEMTPDSGSYEVRFLDGRPSKYFYWEDSRRSPEQVSSEQALERAEAFAKAERAKAGPPVINLPTDAARRLMEDMRAFWAEDNAIKRDEIANRQLHALREHQRPGEKEICLNDVKAMFEEIRDYLDHWGVS